MKNLARAIYLTLAILLGSLVTGCGGDFDKGFDAYESGDFATALQEWTPLAEQGDADAQYNLGWVYENGQGVQQDYEEAVKWYTLAAEQGDAYAQFNLGLMYDKGEGVPKDSVYAYMWWNIAAAGGDKFASESRDSVAKEMTASQIAKAEELARECVRKEYKGC